MGELQRITAGVSDGPQRELAARTRELLSIRYREATAELEAPLNMRVRQLQEGASSHAQQASRLEKQVSSAAQDISNAHKLLVNVSKLQSAAEQMDKRLRILEQLRRAPRT